MPPNVRLFLAFRLFFNARFYYPVLAVFFVDLGLTVDQYTWLNVAWAASIVCFELPLGGFADRFGRRPLIVGASVLMVIEMLVLGFAPIGNPTLLFWLFLANRILSGLAEAAASGADEALAYDSIPEAQQEQLWPDVLARLQRISSAGFLVAMVLGAVVYDYEVMNRVAGWFGFAPEWTQLDTARFPVYLTLGLAFLALASALRMTEPRVEDRDGPDVVVGDENAAGIRAAARWIHTVRFVAVLIGILVVLDSIARLFLTLNSTYYRMLGIPSAWFGVVSAAFAVLGFFTPTVARRLVRRVSPWWQFALVSLLVVGGLAGAALFRTYAGLLFVGLLMVAWQFMGFFGSHHLNAVTSSERRATVLSFRSLFGNLIYGGAGGLYAVAVRATTGSETDEIAAFASSLPWFPIAAAALVVPLLLWARRIPRMRDGSQPA